VAHSRKIAVIGLGYVGLPVAAAFAAAGSNVIGFDIDARRIEELKTGYDRTLEVEKDKLLNTNLNFTADRATLKTGDFFIVTVPTPIDEARRPDLTALLKASETVGSSLKKGDIVVYESTVYPGATEEDCVPVLERVSGLKAGTDFTVGYSPERINPGDHVHRFETITKVVSGQTPETLEIVAAVYGSVVKAGIHKAPSIKVAEAAKVIENTQRDLNIALMNELSDVFHALDVNTLDVLAAAGTKWNFLPFRPGLVGGHCIGVDPYYLTYRAEKAGCHPEVILAGRRTNDAVGPRIARECVRRLMANGAKAPVVTVLGLTFKENVPDIRNSKVVDIITELQNFGVDVQAHDPMADAEDVHHEFRIKLLDKAALKPADAVILAVAHQAYLETGWPLISSLLKPGSGIVLDVKGALSRSDRPSGLNVWSL